MPILLAPFIIASPIEPQSMFPIFSLYDYPIKTSIHHWVHPSLPHSLGVVLEPTSLDI